MNYASIPMRSLLRFLSISVFVLSLLLSSQSLKAQVVPPVQVDTSSSATLSITPYPDTTTPGSGAIRPPNASGSTVPPPVQASTPPVISSTSPIQQAGPPSITLIMDQSGSMHNSGKLMQAQRSAIALLDLIEVWQDVYSSELADMRFNYVSFGGPGEEYALPQVILRSPGDFTQLRTDIRNNNKDLGGTFYGSGLDKAISILQGQGLNNKTLFLSDAEDDPSSIPNPSQNYSVLGDLNFIVYTHLPPTTRLLQKWTSQIPGSSEEIVQDEFGLTAFYVKTLFGFVDDINKYLVRQNNKVRIAGNGSFDFIKHQTDTSHTVVIGRPLENINISRIEGPQGTIDASNYVLAERGTFIHLELNAGLPQGPYKVFFDGAPSSGFDINYISFERTNINLGVNDYSAKQHPGLSCRRIQSGV